MLFYSKVENLLVNNFFTDECCNVSTDVVLHQLGPRIGDDFFLHDDVVLVPTFPGIADVPLAMSVAGDDLQTDFDVSYTFFIK